MKIKTPKKEDQLMQLMQGLNLRMSKVIQTILSLFIYLTDAPKKNCWPRLKNWIVRRLIFSSP